VGSFEGEQKLAKPLTTQFVKRQPRLTKPLELKKRPQPRRRTVQRKMVSVKARMHRDQASVHFQPTQALRGLSRPSVEIGRTSALTSAAMEPPTVASVIYGAKDEERKIDLSLELLDTEALDTGRYHAVVIQDPTDRRNIKGFLHIAIVEPSISEYDFNDLMPAMRRFADLGMNTFTGIRTDVWPILTLDSREIFKVPWVFTFDLGRGLEFSPTRSEVTNLGAYLMQGGFLHADGYPTTLGTYVPPVRLQRLITDALDTQGVKYERDWSFQRLPNNHPIYHCYFDFDGPPVGAGAFKWQYGIVPFIEGVTVSGRLLAITSQMLIARVWVAGQGPGLGGEFDPTPCLQFGVNVVVFALTQEGSITHRLMGTFH
jgi:hypothetical protein